MVLSIDIPFKHKPFPFEYSNRRFNKEQAFLQAEIARSNKIGVIKRDSSLQHFSPINCVPKKEQQIQTCCRFTSYKFSHMLQEFQIRQGLVEQVFMPPTHKT